jgi:predicted RNase H-like HicB family nuclease
MSEKYRFPVEVEIDEDGIYIVSCPMFKACHADGATIDKALDNLREAIEICLEE